MAVIPGMSGCRLCCWSVITSNHSLRKGITDRLLVCGCVCEASRGGKSKNRAALLESVAFFAYSDALMAATA